MSTHTSELVAVARRCPALPGCAVAGRRRARLCRCSVRPCAALLARRLVARYVASASPDFALRCLRSAPPDGAVQCRYRAWRCPAVLLPCHPCPADCAIAARNSALRRPCSTPPCHRAAVWYTALLLLHLASPCCAVAVPLRCWTRLLRCGGLPHGAVAEHNQALPLPRPSRRSSRSWRANGPWPCTLAGVPSHISYI